MVDNTVTGLEPNVPLLKKLSEETGVHIISGTGMLNIEYSGL